MEPNLRTIQGGGLRVQEVGIIILRHEISEAVQKSLVMTTGDADCHYLVNVFSRASTALWRRQILVRTVPISLVAPGK